MNTRNTRLRLLAVSATALIGLAAAVVPFGCFSLKEPPCAFSCVQPPYRCPDQYSCGTDGLCHRQGATGICPLTAPDGGAATGDAGDAARDATDGRDSFGH